MAGRLTPKEDEKLATVRYLIALDALDDACALLGWPPHDTYTERAIVVPVKSVKDAIRLATEIGFNVNPWGFRSAGRVILYVK